MGRRGLLFAVIGGIALASTPTARADIELVTDPVQVHGYAMHLLVEKDQFRHNLTVTLIQRRGPSTQSHSWSKRDTVRFTTAPDLRRGHIQVRFQHWGDIDMRFRARGPTVHKADPSCEYSRRWVRGTLTGKFVLVTGKGRFGRITRSGLSGRIVSGHSVLICHQFPVPDGDDQPEYWFDTPKLGVPLAHGALTVADRAEGTVEHLQQLGSGDLDERGNPREFWSHDIFARSTKHRFSYRRDWSSAHLIGIGPYLDGELSFTATSPSVDRPGLDRARLGVLSGHLGIKRAAPHRILITKGAARMYTESP
jgi:hypothetical protein